MSRRVKKDGARKTRNEGAFVQGKKIDDKTVQVGGTPIDVKLEQYDGPTPKDFTVARIKAATMITLACNTVAQALNTDEGTDSRRAMVRSCDKTFGDMRKCAEECAGDDAVVGALNRGIEAYDAYLALHAKADSLEAGDPGRGAAVKEASAAMEHLADVMNEILHAF